MKYDRILSAEGFSDALTRISNDLKMHAPAYHLKSIGIQNENGIVTYWHISQHDFSNGRDPYPYLIIDQNNVAYCQQFKDGKLEFYLYADYPLQKKEAHGSEIL